MTEGRCPSCGAPVQFTAGTALVVVCGHCNTVVGRAGPALEARGKIGQVVDTDTPLQLHAHGRYDGKGFRIVGHLQKDHGAGPWDEWYAEFEDGRRAWISESEGAFHLTFYEGAYQERPYSALRPGQRLPVQVQGAPRHFVIEELGHARITAAAGELPSDVDPTRDVRYADASSTGGVFCTLDYGTGDAEAELFVGHQVALERLGIPPDQLRPRVKKVSLVQARCTQCNGNLELRAPDRSKRVACPYCGALLDCSGGKLAFLQHLEKPDHEPWIPLGARGTLGGKEWICIGFMVRSCVVDYVRYQWDEYLLYAPGRGFTWLMQSNGHWVHLTPIPAGEVYCSPGTSATYQKKHYKAFQQVNATTDYVLGEFYWEVQAGETASAAEYVLPPYSINVDRTENETTFTLGEYLPKEQVKEAFKLQSLPHQTGIAPSQPNPSKKAAGSAFGWAAGYAVVLLLLFVVFSASASHKLVFNDRVTIRPGVGSGKPEAMYFSQPFEIPETGNVRVELSSPVSNSWFGLQGDLVNEETQEVTSFYTEASYYYGSDWREGSRTDTEYLSRVPAGRYSLRLTPYFPPGARNPQYDLEVTAGTPRVLWMFLGLLALFISPFFNLARSMSFETARWNESNLISHGEE